MSIWDRLRWPFVARWRWADALEQYGVAMRREQDTKTLFFKTQEEYVARIMELEEALRPFADLPCGGRHVDPDQPMEITATGGEIDAARAALGVVD